MRGLFVPPEGSPEVVRLFLVPRHARFRGVDDDEALGTESVVVQR